MPHSRTSPTPTSSLTGSTRTGIAINFVWLLVAGFLVMFMQAGFALVETGFTRAKNALHTMSMNFMIYGIGIVGFFLVGFAFAFGGLAVCRWRQPGHDLQPLGSMLDTVDRRPHWGLLGTTGFALSGSTYDVGVVAFFLFQLVFMDTDRDDPDRALWPNAGVGSRSSSTACSSRCILYPIYANWAWGGGWLVPAGHQPRSGAATRTSPALASSTPSAAGVPWPGRWSSARGSASTTRTAVSHLDARPQPDPGHPGLLHPGLRLVRLQPGLDVRRIRQGALRIGIVAVTTMLASGCGRAARRWSTPGSWTRSPARRMMVNGMLAGLVAITAPSRLRGPDGAVIIGARRWRPGLPGRRRSSTRTSRSMIRSVQSPSMASTACGACSPWASSPTARQLRLATRAKGILYGERASSWPRSSAPRWRSPGHSAPASCSSRSSTGSSPCAPPRRPRSPVSTSRRWAARATRPMTSALEYPAPRAGVSESLSLVTCRSAG